MKRRGYVMPQIVEPDNLRWAFYKARKGKQHKKTVIEYGQHLDEHLARLREGLLNEDFPVGKYHFFTIFDPKKRQICAADFSERVLHHALMNRCHEDFERYQTDDSYASRKGRGTYAAIRKAQWHTRRYTWYAKLDARKYFYSIPHAHLKHQLRKLYKDAKLIRLFERIIDSYEGTASGKGLPIGNLTSQYFANHYLAEADHYVKEQLGVPAYIRYMDDMLLWAEDKEQLKQWLWPYKAFLEGHLGLALKEPILQPVRKGVPFLGYRLFNDRIQLLRQSARRFRQKLIKYHQNRALGIWSEAELQQHLEPLFAFAKQASSKQLRAKILKEIGL